MQNVRWWDAAAVAVTVVIVAVSLLDPPFGADDAATWAAAGAFLLIHVVWGRRCVPVATPRRHLAIAIAYAVLLAIGTTIEPSFAILQAFLYPFVWSTSPSTRSAIVANLLIAVAIVVGYAVRVWPAGLVTGTAVAALSVGFSIALGLWITRIAQYGEEHLGADAERLGDVLLGEVREHRGDGDEPHQDQLADPQLGQEIELFPLLRRHHPSPFAGSF